MDWMAHYQQGQRFFFFPPSLGSSSNVVNVYMQTSKLVRVSGWTIHLQLLLRLEKHLILILCFSLFTFLTSWDWRSNITSTNKYNAVLQSYCKTKLSTNNATIYLCSEYVSKFCNWFKVISTLLQYRKCLLSTAQSICSLPALFPSTILSASTC